MGRTYDAAALLLRGGVGLTFAVAGFGKIALGPPTVVTYFATLGIPAPEVFGPAISALELAGGVAVLVGALTRVFGVLFVAEMIVALAVARLPEAATSASTVDAFAALRLELLLLLSAACLAIAGPGSVSVDAVLLRFARRSRDGRSSSPSRGSP